MKTVYFISGLGADERIFQNLHLEEYDVRHIKWIRPTSDETIESYANRLKEQITTPRPVIVGLSLGGMIAVEISKLIETEKVILLSSVKTKYEMPFYIRWAGFLQLPRIIPFRGLQIVTHLFVYWFNSATTNKERQLIADMISQSDPAFLKWAVYISAKWQSTTMPKNYAHIYGTADRIFPIRFINCNYKIKGGSHVMVLNKAGEITEILKQIV